jgi:hypothetical protein
MQHKSEREQELNGLSESLLGLKPTWTLYLILGDKGSLNRDQGLESLDDIQTI